MRRLSFILGLVLTAWVFVMHMLDLSGPVALENALYDQYQRWDPRPYDPETPVRIITVDDASLARLGQWPWPRTYMAELTRRLTEAGAGVVAFDILFAERDRTTPDLIERTWQRFSTPAPSIRKNGAADHDDAFAQRLSEVLSVAAISGRGLTPEEQGTVPEAPLTKAGISPIGDNPNPALERLPAAIVNLPRFTRAVSGIGAISLGQETGRIVREVPLVKLIAGRRVPALSVETLRLGLRIGTYALKSTGSQSDRYAASVQTVALGFGDFEVPLTGNGAIRVHYSGYQDERSIPAWRVLDGPRLAPEVAAQVAGRLILVGVSAEGLLDIISTPVERRVPGTEVHAEIIEQILADSYLTRPDYADGIEAGGILAFGLIATILGALQRPWLGLAVVSVLLAGAFGWSWISYAQDKVLLGPLFPAFAAVVVYFVLTGVGIFAKERERQAVRQQFAHFVPPGVMRQIADDPDRQLTPSGAERELSVLFLDVRGFSTATETMDPRTVVGFVNDFLTPLSDMILDRGGTIDKFIGDAVMAFWNAPAEVEDHAPLAVQTLLDLPGVVDRINASNQARGLPPIRVGAGVNTGACSVGLMGSRRRLGYTTIGDAVNLASRLEGLTKQYGVMNLIGDATARAAGPGVALLALDRVAVKGRVQPERVHTVIGGPDVLDDPGFAAVAERMTAGRAAYRARDWDAAEAAFRALGNRQIGLFDPRTVTETYVDRITAYRETPPPDDWDGTFTARSK